MQFSLLGPANYRAVLLLTTALTAAAVPAGAQPAPNARPTGGQVVAGTARITQTANTTTIQQSSNRAAVNWTGFDVGSQQTVNFQQPSSASVTLNRVTGPDPSAIAGQIHANGQVILTNPSGVVFYKGAEVNAQSLVVSAPGITTQNFMAGRMVFDQAAHPNASVTNAGTITVRDTGLAAMVAPRVANSGVISARLGHAVLAGAEAATLDMYGDGLVSVDVTKQVTTAPGGKQALVTNTGTIAADGGQVLLTASAVDGVVSKLVDAGGHVRANSVGSKTGTIAINGTGGGIVLSGTIAAMGNLAGTTGGAIEVNSNKAVVVGKRAVVDASGHAGGGAIALGTTLARTIGGPSVTPTMTAARSKIAAGAQIHADAKQSGNGGKITVLSTQSTAMHGTITATGGTSGGNGGLIEVSSAGVVALDGMINVAAPAGRLGEILLDPGTLDIISSGTSTISPNPTEPNVSFAQGGTVGVSYLSASLLGSLTGSIQLFSATDINVLGAINLGSIGQGLYLGAGRNINVAAPITTHGTIVLVASSTSSPLTTTIGGVSISAAVTSNNNNIYLQSQGGGITLGANVNAGTASLSAIAAGGTLSQTAGVITTGTLTGRATYGVSLGQPNLIGTIGTPGTGFTVTKSGNFSLTEAAGTSLFLGGKLAVQSGQTISLQTDALGVNITSPGGGVTSILNGSLYAPSGSVSIAPVTAGRPVLLTAQTTGSYAGAGSVAGTLLLNGQALKYIAGSKLTIGSTAAGAVTVGVSGDGSIGIGGATPTLAPSTLSLISGSSISQNAPLTIGTLTGSAAGVSLTNAANSITNLGSFAVSGAAGFALTDASALTIGSTVSVPAGAPITLDDNRPSFVTGSSLSAAGGVVTLAPATTDSAFTLTGAGSVTAGTLTIGSATEGAVSIAGSIALPSGTIDLLSGGSVSEIGTGSLTAAVLTGSASSASLTGSNTIASLGAFSSSGNFSLTNTGSLTITGFVSAANVGLTISGALIESGGSITTGSLTGSASYISLTGHNLILSSLGSLTSTTGLVLNSANYLSISGPVTAGSFATIASAELITVGGTITAPTIDLVGGVTESAGGSLVATTLSGTAAGNALLQGTNAIGTLSNFIVGDSFTLTDSIPLTIAGSIASGPAALVINDDSPTFATGASLVTSANTVTLAPATVGGSFTLSGSGTVAAETLVIGSTTAGAVTIAGSVNLVGGVIDLVSGGSVSETTTGGLTAATLTGSATSASLTGSNTITSLGSFAATGAFALTNTGSLDVTGLVSASSVGLVVAGSLTESAGTISTGTLTGSAASVALIQSGNSIGTLNGFVSAGGLTLTDGIALRLAGSNVAGTGATLEINDDAPGYVGGASLSAPGGSVILAPGTIGDPLALVGVPTVTAGTLVLGSSTAGAVTIAGSIALAAGVLDLLSSAGVSETGVGSLSAPTLTGSVGSASLTGSSNVITTLGSFTSSTGFALRDSGSLTVTGPVKDGSSVAITVGAGLNISGTIAAPTVTLLVPSVINETSGGALVATTLTGSAASAALIQTANAVGTLSAFQTTVGGFTLTDGAALTIAGSNAVVTSGTLEINDDSPSFATGASLNAPAGTVALAPAGTDAFTLAGIGTITAGNLTIGSATAGAVSITGSLSLPSGVIDLLSSSSVSESGAGSLTAATLIGSAASASLTGSNSITSLGSFTTSGAFALTSAGSLAVTGLLSASSVGLVASGSLTETGVISTGTITGSATTAVLTGSNTIAALGSFTATGGLSLSNTGTLALAGTVTAPTVDLLITGALSEPSGGDLVATTLTGSAASAALIQSANRVGTLSAFQTSIGGFTLSDGSALAIVGSNTVPSGATLAINDDTPSFATGASLNAAGGTVVLAPTGTDAFTLAGIGSITAGTLTVGSATGGAVAITGSLALPAGVIDLLSSSSVSESGSGGLTAATLIGNAASVSLAGSNSIASLGSFATTGAFSIINTGALSLSGPFSAGSAAIRATGALSETSAASVTVGTLTGSAISVSLTGTGNSISSIGSFSATGSFALTDQVALSVSGPLSGSAVALSSTGALTLPGSISATTVLSLVGSAISGTGALSAGTLTGSASSYVSLTGANAITNLGSFTSLGLALNNTGSLSVTGPVSAPDFVTISNSGALSIGGTISAAFADLLVGGAITEPTGGNLAVSGTLTGSAASVALIQATNTVGTLNNFISAGNFTLTDSVALHVQGSNVAGTGATLALNDDPPAFSAGASLSAPGGTIILAPGTIGDPLVLTNTINVTAGTLVIGSSTAGAVTLGAVINAPGGVIDLLSSGSVTESGAVITAGTLIGSAASVALTGTGNSFSNIGSFSSTGSFALTDQVPLSVAGPLSGSAVALSSTGTLTLPGSVSTGGALSLVGSGISGSGVLATGTLTGSSSSSVSLTGSNVITNLGRFTSSGGFVLTNAGALSLTGPVTDSTLATITTGGALTIAGTLNAPTISLFATGAVTEPTGGALVATTLTGSAASAALIQVGSANSVGTLSAFRTTVGGFTLTDGSGTALTIAGSNTVPTGATLELNIDTPSFAPGASLNAPGGSVVLAPTGTLAGLGSITAGTLTIGSATGGAVSITGSVALASGVIDLLSDSSVTESGAGSLTATTLIGNTPSASLTGNNAIANLGNFTTSGAFALTNTSSLTLTGLLSSASAALNVSGALSESSSGAIITSTLTGSAGSALLGGSNTIAILGSFASTSGLSLNNSGALAIIGPVTDSAFATIVNTGSLTIYGSLSAPILDLVVSGYPISEMSSGPYFPFVIASSLSDSATTASLIGYNSIAALGSITATAGLTLNNTGNLSVAGTVNAPSINLVTTGTLSEATGGSLVATSLTGSAASASLIQVGNSVGTLSAFTTTVGGFTLTDGIALTISGSNTAPSGATLAIKDDSPTFLSGASLNAPSGTVVLAPAGSDAFTLAGIGSITAGTLTIGSTSAGPVTIAGSLSLPSEVIDLLSASSVTESGSGSLTAATLTGSAASASLLGGNSLSNLGSFATTTGFALSNQSALTVGGPVTDGAGIALTTASGALSLGGTINAPSIVLDAGGAITQTGGALTATTLLTGSATGAVQLGIAGSAAISYLGSFSVTGAALTLNSSVDMTVGGPLAATALNLSAPNNLTLSGGTLTIGANSTLAVGGDPAINQTGSTTIAGSGSLTFSLLPGSGSISFADLEAPGTSVNLSLGSGSASGMVTVRALNLASASGGTATLTGSIDGIATSAAAQHATIAPAGAPTYTFNACIIASISCTTPIPATTTPVTPGPMALGPTPPDQPDIIAIVEQAAAAQTRATVQVPFLNGFLSFIFSQDLDDPDLVLPNISDRDY